MAKPRLFYLVLPLLLGAGWQTAAQPAGASPSAALPVVAGWACSPEHEALRAADVKLVSGLLHAGLSAATARQTELEAVLSHAPGARWPLMESCGSSLLVHMEDPLAAMLLGSAVAAKYGAKSMRVLSSPMPYPQAALLLGSVHNEAGRFEQALAVLERGSALDPSLPMLISERAFALSQLHRPAEALAVADAGLAANPKMPPVSKAMLQRKRGFALGEMDRFDEAMAAYQLAQRLDPADRTAANELIYLSRRKAGRAPTPVWTTTMDKQRDPPPASARPASAPMPRPGAPI